jgi:thiamine pyridinylase
MRRHVMRLGLSALLLLSTGACATARTPTVTPPPAANPVIPTVLRVALFPYLPDVGKDTLQSLQDSIEIKFERANPLVDLQLRRMDPGDDDFYVPDSVAMWLRSQDNGAGYHVVEVDAIMLGDLAAQGVMQAWSSLGDSANWISGPLPALSWNGTVYGIPHWLCGDFILSRYPAVNAATTVDDLVAALNGSSPNVVKVSGALGGSWTLPALYLHGWADVYGPQGMAGALGAALDSTAVQKLRSVLDFCKLPSGVNTCLAADQYDSDSSVAIYASGRSDAFLGFSERLTAIMLAGAPNTDSIHLSPAPLGPTGSSSSNVPVLYVDALVLGSGCGDELCQQAATAFSTFLLSDSTYQWILTSQDVGSGQIPRYLLPATRSAFQVQGVAGDPHFLDMWNAIQGGTPLPNANFASNRKTMQRELRAALGSPIPPSP